MTKKERQILKQAAEIISVELLRGHEVPIPNFGRFKTSELEIYRAAPGVEINVSREKMRTVRFKPFTALKQLMNLERKETA